MSHCLCVCVHVTLPLMSRVCSGHTASVCVFMSHCLWCHVCVHVTLPLVPRVCSCHTASGATCVFMSHCLWCHILSLDIQRLWMYLPVFFAYLIIVKYKPCTHLYSSNL